MAPNYLDTFRCEAEELLEQIEARLLALEGRPDAGVDDLFRAFHTLKGSSGVAGIPSIALFTHHVETALDRVRNGSTSLTQDLVTILLAAKDHVAALLAAATGGPSCDPARGAALVARLQEIIANAPAAAPRRMEQVVAVDYLITFTPTAPLEAAAADILDELRALGACQVLASADAAPQGDAALAAWRLLLTTTRGEDAIRDAFIFVAGAGDLTIDRGFSQFTDESPAAPSPAAAPPSVAGAGAAAAPVSSESTVRVPRARLDHLVKLVGELVIAQARLQQASATAAPQLAEPVEAMQGLLADLRDSVLGLRMVPIGTTFTRFQRLVRDLSNELGRNVELVTAGDDTELDKSVIDQLADPLVHLLRNSMDHGMEPPAERRAAGKPERGTIRLTATQDGTHVILAISDDGRGIDCAAVRRIAEQRGLVAPGQVLSEQDTLALITRPGFSTAKALTQLSGRGVGMDVVKQTVERLRGSLSITSQLGAGTTIRLRLPLTLAIIDGLLVEIGGERFIVPMGAITENLELGRAERQANNGRNVVPVRGELVPYVRLREVFAMGDGEASHENVVVVVMDDQRVGLVVDKVIGSHQTVIQPLGRFYCRLPLFSGTTILADGRVAMILDIAGTVRWAGRPAAELHAH